MERKAGTYCARIPLSYVLDTLGRPTEVVGVPCCDGGAAVNKRGGVHVFLRDVLDAIGNPTEVVRVESYERGG